jgi:hypothetical protein
MGLGWLAGASPRQLGCACCEKGRKDRAVRLKRNGPRLAGIGRDKGENLKEKVNRAKAGV